MKSTELLPLVAAALFGLFGLSVLAMSGRLPKGRWLFPASLSLAFLAFSVTAVWAEGPTGFWVEHTRNLWGNQIWFDLLLTAGIGWCLIVPQARAVGMRLLPWFVLVAGTGSIGFTAMLARLLYLQDHKKT